jgi:putative transcriptional regulator
MSRTSISAKMQIESTSRPFEAGEAVADPDAKPLTRSNIGRMRRTPQVRVIRRALGLTQEEFAARYHIPLGTLRDWEQGRGVPDQPARAYLKLIAHDPEHVRKALNESEVASRPVD